LRRLRIAAKFPAADLHDDAGGLAVLQARQDFREPIEQVFVDPVTHEMIGREQAERVAVFDGVQRSNPGVELLRGELSFEAIETPIPQRRPHPRGPPMALLERSRRGGECITVTGSNPSR
jgi:hypothetical protein